MKSILRESYAVEAYAHAGPGLRARTAFKQLRFPLASSWSKISDRFPSLDNPNYNGNNGYHQKDMNEVACIKEKEPQ